MRKAKSSSVQISDTTSLQINETEAILLQL